MIAVGFVAAAFAGAIARALITGLEAPFARQMWGTLIINVLGAFLLGLLHASSERVLVVIGIGGLGSLTTFSTFISQVDYLEGEGSRRDAALYLIGTVVLGIGAAWVGWTVS